MLGGSLGVSRARCSVSMLLGVLGCWLGCWVESRCPFFLCGLVLNEAAFHLFQGFLTVCSEALVGESFHFLFIYLFISPD